MLETLENGIAVFRPLDLTDATEHEALLSIIDASINEGTIYFIVDLSALPFLNSSGLNFLILMLTKVRNSGGDIVIANLSESIQKILVITRLQSTFIVVDSVQNGLHFFLKLQD